MLIKVAISVQVLSQSTLNPGMQIYSIFLIYARTLVKKNKERVTYSMHYGYLIFSCNELKPMLNGRLCVHGAVLGCPIVGGKISRNCTRNMKTRVGILRK